MCQAELLKAERAFSNSDECSTILTNHSVEKVFARIVVQQLNKSDNCSEILTGVQQFLRMLNNSIEKVSGRIVIQQLNNSAENVSGRIVVNHPTTSDIYTPSLTGVQQF